jgi:hypothetical protein
MGGLPTIDPRRIVPRTLTPVRQWDDFDSKRIKNFPDLSTLDEAKDWAA